MERDRRGRYSRASGKTSSLVELSVVTGAWPSRSLLQSKRGRLRSSRNWGSCDISFEFLPCAWFSRARRPCHSQLVPLLKV